MRCLAIAFSAVLLNVPALVLGYDGTGGSGGIGEPRGVIGAQTRPPAVVEHRLAGGAIELHTRYGRFCIMPTPTYSSSDLGTNTTLASRCARL